MAPRPAPPLNIPAGTDTVRVSAIDSTLWLSATHTSNLYSPPIPGFGRVRCGCWSLLIQHPSGRKLLYDLGTRPNPFATAPPTLHLPKLKEDGVLEELRVESHVAKILQDGRDGGNVDVAGGEIEAVIWSHWHWDHTGDMATFPPSTRLIVGPGFKENFMPGWTVDPDAQTAQSDFEGREVCELQFERSNAAGAEEELRIGNFRAIDYFGDGSFYVLDSPGHAVGHVNALARVMLEPEERFVHMCGDSARHCGEIRPSVYRPLPDSISPSPVPSLYPAACPGEIFESVLREGRKDDHILELMDIFTPKDMDRKYALIYDEPELRQSVRKVEGLDANENVFTILAHDWSLKGIIDEWPATLNDWMNRNESWKRDVHWRFLADFAGAVKRD